MIFGIMVGVENNGVLQRESMWGTEGTVASNQVQLSCGLDRSSVLCSLPINAYFVSSDNPEL